MAYSAQPTGVLAKIIQRVRTLSNEPETDAKYTPELFWPFIQAAYEHAMREMNAIGDHPIIVRYSVTTVAGTQSYYLPCNVGQIIRYGFRDSQSGLMRDWVVPRSHLNPAGSGVKFEGNVMYIDTLPKQSDVVVVEYVPTGECYVHKGTVDQDDFTTTTLVLDQSPDEGYFDQRPNAPLGCMLRVISGPTPTGYAFFPVQERVISGYDTTTGTVTVSVPFDVDFSGETGSYVYEIVPWIMPQLTDVVAWDITAQFNGIGKDYNAASYAERQFSRVMRDVRLANAKSDGRKGSLIHNDITGVQDAWIY